MSYVIKKPQAIPLKFGTVAALYPQAGSDNTVRGYRLTIMAPHDASEGTVIPAQAIGLTEQDLETVFALLWEAGYRPAEYAERLEYLAGSVARYLKGELTNAALADRARDVIAQLA